MSRIWQGGVDLSEINALNKKDMLFRLGFTYTRIGDDFLAGEFSIDERTRQPFGLLHGGISCAVSESMGGVVPICAWIVPVWFASASS